MDPIVVVVILLVMALAFSLTIAVSRTLKRSPQNDKFEDVLAQIAKGDADPNTDLTGSKTGGISGRGSGWVRYWQRIMVAAGREVKDPTGASLFIAGIAIFAAFVGVVLFPRGPLGLVLAPISLIVVKVYFSLQVSRRTKVIEKQLPLLLQALRAQMHSGQIPEAALLAIADDLPSPIGDEIRTVKADVTVGVPLFDALQSLANRSGSRQMQFLVSSMGVAINSGSDLIPQLINIEEVVRQRAEVRNAIRSGLAATKPTLYVATAAPFVIGGYEAYADPSWLPFMFSAKGIIFLLVSAGLLGTGLFIVRLMVKNLENS